MNTLTTRFGKLTTRVVDDLPAGASPALLVVLCHGFGAPGDDLVSLAAEVLRERPALAGRVRFLFPEAPLSLDGLGYAGARAWWPLDLERIGALVAQGRVRDLAEEEPEGLAPARRLLRGALEAMTRQAGLPLGRVVLGGFSQGAMLATDTALRLEEAPAALCVLSGALLAATQWRRLAPARRGLAVLQSHGRQDMVLPYFGAAALREVLEGAGLDVTFAPFDGQHTIARDTVKRLAGLLAALAAP